jgi:monoamine oxidase
MGNPVVAIVGGGLSGLWAASLLRDAGVSSRILEARDRVGGRALSITSPIGTSRESESFDLGATWIWPEKQPRINSLIAKLGVRTLPQFADGAMLVERFRLERASAYSPSPGQHPVTLRIEGGVQSLTIAIEAGFPRESIQLHAQVKQILRSSTNGILLRLANSQEIHADIVIMALPPRLIAQSIAFDPPLSSRLVTQLHKMPTWVGGQAKAVALYKKPFWRAQGLSGMASSFIGPLQEIHDASPREGAGALMGFSALTPAARTALGEQSLRELILAQLERLFGAEARAPEALLMKDWAQDPYTASREDREPANEYPVYGLPADAEHLWDGRLLFAGSEFAEQNGGFLEGAIVSAERVARQVIDRASLT